MDNELVQMESLRIPLKDIQSATENFSHENVIGIGGFGKVYSGILSQSEGQRKVAVKRLDQSDESRQGRHEFLMEITLLSSYRHKNLVSLVGFCEDNDEMILVYEYESRGSLNKLLHCMDLTWIQRLRICTDAARGLKYLHHDLGPQHRVLHRDIKSANILLNEDWEAKVSDFGLSRLGPANQQFTFVVSHVCGTQGYIDPLYNRTGILTKESDVYSFGVVLFEVLCGRPAVMNYEDERRFLARLARHRYEEERLDEIINPDLRRQINPLSFRMYSGIAYQCVNTRREGRPTMKLVLETLESALQFQEGKIEAVGVWGHSSSGQGWSFFLQSNHKLRKITIDHEDWLYSLIFTIENSDGKLNPTEKIGGWNGPSGGEITEINFDADEEIIGISGTVGVSTGTYRGYTVISSLSFITNKRIHGPFGQASGDAFSKLWEEGAFFGFHGRAGYYIDGIGVYLKATK